MIKIENVVKNALEYLGNENYQEDEIEEAIEVAIEMEKTKVKMQESKDKLNKALDYLKVDDLDLLSWINTDWEYGYPWETILKDNLSVFGYTVAQIEKAVEVANN